MTTFARQLISLSLGAGLLLGATPIAAQWRPYALHTGREVALTATGAGLLIAAFAVQQAQEPFTQTQIDALDPADVNAFDRRATEQWSPGAATASDVLVLTLLVSPLGLAASEFRRGQTVTLGLMYVETLFLAAGTTQLLKGVTNRTRPYAYNRDPAIPEEHKLDTHARRSFASGHTSTAFAAAVFLSSTYSRLHPQSPARTWVWIGSLASAGTVGYLRYRAGEHFPTDIIAGAVIGAAAGYLVPKLHETGPVYIAPSEEGLALGAVLQF